MVSRPFLLQFEVSWDFNMEIKIYLTFEHVIYILEACNGTFYRLINAF